MQTESFKACTYMYNIYIKAQLLVKVINTDHSCSHLTEAVCAGPEHSTPLLENSQEPLLKQGS